MLKKILPVFIIVVFIIGIIYLLSEPISKNDTPKPEETPNTKPEFAAKLQIVDTQVGQGREVKPGDQITIHYTGTLEDGTKFDSSYDRKAPFETKIGVGQVIKGWDEGVVGMKVGGKRHLVIPPNLGYGEKGAPPKIPPHATLIFDVELLAIK